MGRGPTMRFARLAPTSRGSHVRPMKAKVIDNRMSPRVHIDCEFPPELVEAIAKRVAELLASRAEDADRWMTTAEAADYLRCPLACLCVDQHGPDSFPPGRFPIAVPEERARRVGQAGRRPAAGLISAPRRPAGRSLWQPIWGHEMTWC